MWWFGVGDGRDGGGVDEGDCDGSGGAGGGYGEMLVKIVV